MKKQRIEELVKELPGDLMIDSYFFQVIDGGYTVEMDNQDQLFFEIFPTEPVSVEEARKQLHRNNVRLVLEQVVAKKFLIDLLPEDMEVSVEPVEGWAKEYRERLYNLFDSDFLDHLTVESLKGTKDAMLFALLAETAGKWAEEETRYGRPEEFLKEYDEIFYNGSYSETEVEAEEEEEDDWEESFNS